jgi:hypothetical protein
MLDPRFIEQIVTAWRADEAHPHRYRQRRDLPPLEVLQRFIDMVFLATLKDEEGRPVRFSVVLAADTDLQEPRGSTTLPPLQLALTHAFSAESLVKLAAAFDPGLTTIAVKWDATQSELIIWGILLHAPGKNRFTEVPVGIEGSANFRPDYFTAIAKGRASIAIARGDSLIGTLQAGYFVSATPTPFMSTSLGGHVHALVQRDPLFAAHGNDFWLHVRDAFELLLSEAALRGHGGTIVLLPSLIDQNTGLYASKYELLGSFGLRRTLEWCILNSGSFEIGIAYRKLANETIQRIAQLASVDGALILTIDFEVLAFGATLTAPRSLLQALVGPDGFGRPANTPFEVSRYGTRHMSAFDFVSAQPDAIAFVISQDGPIRAFRRETDTTVYVWPDCTASMFV